MQELLRRRPDLTAVFVFNDMMAIGAIRALHAQGIRVPEDVSIIGYDNILYASAFEPVLTTAAFVPEKARSNLCNPWDLPCDVIPLCERDRYSHIKWRRQGESSVILIVFRL